MQVSAYDGSVPEHYHITGESPRFDASNNHTKLAAPPRPTDVDEKEFYRHTIAEVNGARVCILCGHTSDPSRMHNHMSHLFSKHRYLLSAGDQIKFSNYRATAKDSRVVAAHPASAKPASAASAPGAAVPGAVDAFQALSAAAKAPASEALAGKKRPSEHQASAADMIQSLNAISRKAKFAVVIAMTICLGSFPYSFVSNPGMNLLLAFCGLSSIVPSRTFITAKIKELYKLLHARIIEVFTTIPSFSFTMDMWTSKTGLPFAGVTAHWISTDWVLKHRFIALKYFPGSHTASNILSALHGVLEEYGIPISKWFGMTTDTGANIWKAFEDAKMVVQLPCFAHTGQLVLLHAFDKADKTLIKALDSCHELARAIKESPQRLQALHAAGAKLSPIINSSTRWNARFYTVSRCLDLLPAYNAIPVNTCFSTALQRKNWQAHLDNVKLYRASLEAILPVLERFVVWTQALSSRTTPTFSLAYHALKDLRQYLTTLKDSKDPLVKSLGVALDKQMDEYFGNWPTNTFVLLAAALDPRVAHQLTPSEIAGAILQMDSMAPAGAAPVVDSDEDATGWGSMQSPASASTSYEAQKLAFKQAMILVKNTGKARDVDVMQWYKQNQGHFPIIADIARKLLAVQVTEADSERLFSRSGRIAIPTRGSLSHQAISEQTLIGHWLVYDDPGPGYLPEGVTLPYVAPTIIIPFNIPAEAQKAVWAPDEILEEQDVIDLDRMQAEEAVDAAAPAALDENMD
jgi:hypothetical protein